MNKIVTQLEAADIATVLKMLPHRYPFLMVDRVIDIRGDEHGIGIKNVTINEPHFQGHFPGNPVFPGVLMIEGTWTVSRDVSRCGGIAARQKWPARLSPRPRSGPCCPTHERAYD
jgi:hypothetical protein